jgi:hypothetical protein
MTCEFNNGVTRSVGRRDERGNSVKEDHVLPAAKRPSVAISNAFRAGAG